MSWTNADGLTIKFGVEEGVLRNIGAYCMYGPVHWVEILVDHSELEASGTLGIVNDNFAIPEGAIIESVTVVKPTEAFDSAGDALTFSLGLMNRDRSTSDDSPTALINAATQTEMNAGGTNTAGWIDGGDNAVNTGVALTESKLLTWTVGGASATAGKTVIRVLWSKPPKNAEDTLVWNKSA